MIGKVLRKELVDALRDRKTLFLMAFIPLVLIMGLVLFMDRMANEREEGPIPVAVSAQADPGLVRLLEGIPQLEVKKGDDPLAMVKENQAQLALQAPPDVMKVVEQGGSTQLTIYGDRSSLKTEKALAYLQGQLEGVKQQVVAERLGAKGIEPSFVQPFVLEVKNTEDKDAGVGIVSYMLPLLVVVMMMTGSLPAATDLFAGEKERKTIESLLMTPVPRWQLLMAKWMTVAVIAVVSGLITILSFFLSVTYLTENMKGALDYGDHLGAILAASTVGIVLAAMLYAALLMTVSMLAKTFKEAQSYMGPVMFVGMVPVYALFGKSANELAWYHFAVPFLNIAALFKELIYGSVVWAHLGYMVVSTLMMIALVVALGAWMYSKDRWVLGK
jgi:sodium transport system permease protein